MFGKKEIPESFLKDYDFSSKELFQDSENADVLMMIWEINHIVNLIKSKKEKYPNFKLEIAEFEEELIEKENRLKLCLSKQ